MEKAEQAQDGDGKKTKRKRGKMKQGQTDNEDEEISLWLLAQLPPGLSREKWQGHFRGFGRTVVDRRWAEYCADRLPSGAMPRGRSPSPAAREEKKTHGKYAAKEQLGWRQQRPALAAAVIALLAAVVWRSREPLATAVVRAQRASRIETVVGQVLHCTLATE
jgi:hypothetical protein